jgi:hypothetical protein
MAPWLSPAANIKESIPGAAVTTPKREGVRRSKKTLLSSSGARISRIPLAVPALSSSLSI